MSESASAAVMPSRNLATDIRLVRASDARAVAEIYGHHVQYGTASFEEAPPGEQEMAERIRAIRAQHYPWLVAELDSRTVGYAYLGPYGARSAYRFTAEDSIYLAPDCVGRGIGSQLLQALLAHARKTRKFASIMAVIGDSANGGSIGVHRKAGFQYVGTANGLGYKFGRFIDVVYMQLILAENPSALERPKDTACVQS